MQHNTIILKHKGKEIQWNLFTNYKNKNKGINGEVTKNEIFPEVLNYLEIDYEKFELTNFRYYLGQCIYNLKIEDTKGDIFEGHYISSKVTSRNVLEIS